MTKKTHWRVQIVDPRDWHRDCTRPLEEWLADNDTDREVSGSLADKWMIVMQVCALVVSEIDTPGLSSGPRVGYDPARDQMYFFFKAYNNRKTIIVSPDGINLDPPDSGF